MTVYPVYLEVAEDRPWMAHVLALPGCFVRGHARAEALERLPRAIRDYHAWLRQHGEPAPSAEDPIEVEVAEEVRGSSTAHPGDMAAQFAPEREPITPEEMERYFRLLAHSRADLLGLVADLPDGALDWPPDPDAYTVRRLLRHIGNAEEWYVSRLVPPETLPAEWEHDEDMPLYEFLEMERRTALARLRQLTDDERANVFYPTHRTRHPEEPWTTRKTLRRFLEHEREHRAQIGELMETHRRHLLAGLHAARSDLLGQLLGLDDQTFTEITLHGDWTLKDVLAHIAAWDRWVLQELRRRLTGEPPDLAAVRDIDGFNAASVATWRDRSPAEVIAELQEARQDWVAWMEGLPVGEFFRRRPVGQRDWSPPVWVHVMAEHDAEEAKEIAAWREAQGLKREHWNLQTGRHDALWTALAGARQEVLSAVTLVPAEERETRPIFGDWTLKDILGHIAEWEWISLESLRHVAAGQPPPGEEIPDLDVWNQAHVVARREQSWEAIWGDVLAAREAFLEALAGIPPADLGRTFTAPWDEQITLYSWVYIQWDHDREHARDIRGAFLGAEEEAEES